jgi:hypothetical protein
MPNKGFLLVIANSLSVSTNPLILFRESTQLLNDLVQVKQSYH